MIVCIVINQGLSNQIKSEKVGLFLCFIEINSGNAEENMRDLILGTWFKYSNWTNNFSCARNLYNFL